MPTQAVPMEGTSPGGVGPWSPVQVQVQWGEAAPSGKCLAAGHCLECGVRPSKASLPSRLAFSSPTWLLTESSLGIALPLPSLAWQRCRSQ